MRDSGRCEVSIWEPTDQVVAFPWMYQTMRFAFTFKLPEYWYIHSIEGKQSHFEWPYILTGDYLLRPEVLIDILLKLFTLDCGVGTPLDRFPWVNVEAVTWHCGKGTDQSGARVPSSERWPCHCWFHGTPYQPLPIIPSQQSALLADPWLSASRGLWPAVRRKQGVAHPRGQHAILGFRHSHSHGTQRICTDHRTGMAIVCYIATCIYKLTICEV